MFFFPYSVLNTQYHFHYLKHDQLPKGLSNQIFTLINSHHIYYLMNRQIYKTDLEYPFIEYDQHGFIANYTEDGSKIKLYHLLNVVSYNDIHQYPRISYPYILWFEKDQTVVHIASLENPQNILATIESNDLISCWKSSPNGQYLILGNLSGDLFIFDGQQKKVSQHSLSGINSFIQKIGITDQGFYYLLGQEPKSLIYGYFNAQKQTFKKEGSVKMDHSLFHQDFIATSQFLFINNHPFFERYQFHTSSLSLKKTLSIKPYNLFLARDIGSHQTLLGYSFQDNAYIFDLINNDENRIIFSDVVESKTIPICLKHDKHYYIILGSKVIVI